jgi:hypothetical protein
LPFPWQGWRFVFFTFSLFEFGYFALESLLVADVADNQHANYAEQSQHSTQENDPAHLNVNFTNRSRLVTILKGKITSTFMRNNRQINLIRPGNLKVVAFFGKHFFSEIVA